jgi:hypothetical protein
MSLVRKARGFREAGEAPGLPELHTRGAEEPAIPGELFLGSGNEGCEVDEGYNILSK